MRLTTASAAVPSGVLPRTIGRTGTASGLRPALVNYEEKLEGFQVGALNIAKSGGMVPFMVIANWKK